MAIGKQYKNVYTILEKVKKGEISKDSHYKAGEGLFEKINFYKKPDLVKPLLHYIDERRLSNIVDTFMEDSNNTKNYFDKFKNSTGFVKLDEDKKPDMREYHQVLLENYRKFPKHLKYDIQKMYYHQIDKLDFEERIDTNAVQFKYLEKANNPVGKIMTEGSNLKSAIFTRNMMMYFLQQITRMSYIDPTLSKKMEDGVNGTGDPMDNDEINQMMKDVFDNKQGKTLLDDALKDAQDTCNAIDNAIDSETQEKMFEEATKFGGNLAGNMSPEYLRQVAANLQNINLSLSSLKSKIVKLLDKSSSYFSSRKETIREDLFSSGNLAGLEDYELLHPKLRKVFIEDLTVKETITVGKIDIYIDISGSMSGSCGVVNDKGDRITKLDFAKAFVVKLQQMNMLNDVYLFNTTVKKYRADPISLAMLDSDGGTTIDKAVQSIENNPTNALVITDAEDSCHLFSEKAFFIGVEGADFGSFNKNVISEYSDRGQVVVFDGSTILNVNRKGETILP